jgi:uroporphyrinogen III methyltransferase/synthase
LVTALAEAGADVALVPCLAIAPPSDPAALRRALGQVGASNGVIVSSPAAARAMSAALLEDGKDARALAGRRIVAIGEGTAAALRHAGLLADLVPTRASSEGLVEALRDREWLDGAWIHVSAEGSRDVIRDAIEGAGGRYVAAASHRTVRPAVPEAILDGLRPTDAGGDGFDAVVLASGKTARHLLETLREAWGEAMARERLAAAKVIAIGRVTADAIASLDVRVDAIASTPTDAGIVEATIAVLRE